MNIRFSIKTLLIFLLFIVLLVAGILLWAWQSVTWYPEISKASFECKASTAIYDTNQPLKIVSYNVQFMAGKNYFFFYEGGMDTKPSNKDITWTIEQVAELIRQEQPDIVLLQEVNDEGDSRTHYRDQLTELQNQLAAQAFPCHAQAHYWQAGLVLHPKIFGSVSMKLVTLSRYHINQAWRHQLPIAEGHTLKQRFYFQRAILEAHLPTKQNDVIAVLNTHFDAWTGRSNLLKKQTDTLTLQLEKLEQANMPWIVAGDFNALPPDQGRQWHRLKANNIHDYKEKSDLTDLYHRYNGFPLLSKLNGSDAKQFYTYLPNDPAINHPDRTIDYIFYSHQWQILNANVIKAKALTISDHLPLTSTFVRQ